jgi:hypothetical protein
VFVLRVVISTSAAARIEQAAAFLDARSPAGDAVLVGASRGAADDLARAIARRTGATFGLNRFSLTQLAARLAASALAESHSVPGTQAGSVATASRAVFDAMASGELSYFAPVAATPGFPKALASTLHELRLARLGPGQLMVQPDDRMDPAADIGRLLARFEDELKRALVTDRAALFRLAAEACSPGRTRWVGLPLVLLDVPLDSRASREDGRRHSVLGAGRRPRSGRDRPPGARRGGARRALR